MLDGEMSYLLGARKLAALKHEAAISADDTDFMKFVAIASEVDDFPLGGVREHWDAQALEKLSPQIQAAEDWAKKHAASACLALVFRFG
jgi:hypothetical protein